MKAIFSAIALRSTTFTLCERVAFDHPTSVKHSKNTLGCLVMMSLCFQLFWLISILV